MQHVPKEKSWNEGDARLGKTTGKYINWKQMSALDVYKRIIRERLSHK